jgi:hypothetical protein
MSALQPVVTPNEILANAARPESDAERLQRLRKLGANSPGQAKQMAWDWLRELQKPSEHYRLSWLFAQGSAPDAPDGDCEGIVMNLYGAPWLAAMDRLVRLGQLLGGIGWSGKTFKRDGTGYNRLTPGTRIAAMFVMPRYQFTNINGELTGFHFFHAIEPSPLAPHAQVRAIKYDAPIHANPLVLPRTRDELVEIVPNIYLGRALVRNAHDWRVVGYFGLRFPLGGN